MAPVQILILCLVAVAVFADKYEKHPNYREIYHSQDGYHNYKFGYNVHDHKTYDKHSQYETKHGYEVKGHYSLQDPYGYDRDVHYEADKYGTRQHVKGSYYGLYVHSPYYSIEPSHGKY